MSELTHILDIVQEKLKTLNKRRIDHVQKIAAKRSLLQQSYSVLQHDLKMALVQDKKTLHSISNNNNSNTLQLVPIVSSQTEQAPAAESKNSTHKAEQLFELVECQGWIRAGQVIIRASGMALLDGHDISQAHLWLPNNNDFSPQDIRLNTRYNVLAGTRHVFYMAFPLLLDGQDEQDMGTHAISCVYKVDNEYYTSESIPIRYSNNPQDTSWLLDSIHVLQVYFTCRVRIKQPFKLDNSALKKLSLRPVSQDNDSLFISKDQTILIHIVSNDAFDIYGFKASKVTFLVSKYKHDFCIMSHDDNTLKNLILSLGDESLTFGTVDYPNARAKMHRFMATR